MAQPTPQQRYGLGAAPSGASKPMGGLAQKRKTKAVTVSGKRFAMGGSVGRVVGSVLRPSPAPVARPSASQPGNRMIQKYADGGKVTQLDQETVDNINGSANAMEAAAESKRKSAAIPRIEVTAKRMTPAEAKAYDEAQKHDVARTVNGAPIHNPRPANLPAGSGGVRG